MSQTDLVVIEQILFKELKKSNQHNSFAKLSFVNRNKNKSQNGRDVKDIKC